MKPRELKRLEKELRDFLESMVEGQGRPERRAAMSNYVTGLLLDGERKSVVPMASRLVDNADEIEAMRQRLTGCVSESDWRDEEVYERLALKFVRALPGVEAFVIDDTGFPKKGEHSVGVHRQYSGTLGRVDNCQVATSLHLAGEAGSGCIGMRLYLPQEWCENQKRRRKAGVPDAVSFEPKWKLALGHIDAALAWGIPKYVALADAGYGDVGEFREGLAQRGLKYLVGVTGTASMWPPEAKPQVRGSVGGPGRPSTRFKDETHPPMAMSAFAKTLKHRKVTWREGSRGRQASRFAAARIRTAHQRQKSEPPGQEQWLLSEWPAGEAEPTKFYLTTLPENASLKSMVRMAKLRWRVERDYQELKQEVGLDHFEGRTWRGFHHHAALCATAHGFLALRRALFPPEQNEVDFASRPPDASTSPPSDRRLLSALSASA